MSDPNSKHSSVDSDSLGAAPNPIPELMTMDECIEFLRIPEISKSSDHKNVIKNLIRFRHLPRIQICKTLLFPRSAVLEWVQKETISE